MPLSQLPNELWIHVFEDNADILDPPDLSAIVRTCKTFRDLALRILYRRISWTDPFHLVHALDFWRIMRAADPLSVQSPKSLLIGVSRMCVSSQANIVGLDGTAFSKAQSRQATFAESSDMTSALVLRSGETAYDFSIDFFASAPLHHAMMTLASEFVNLEELVFTKVILPQSFHKFIHEFPRLNKLRLEICAIPATGTVPNHATLPITELSLLSLYYAVDLAHPLFDHMTQRNPMEFFSLTSAQALSTLHVDSTAPFFSVFGHDGSPPVPVNLRHIFLHRPRPTRTDIFWRSTDPHSEGTRRDYDHSTIMLSMAGFLSLCPSIESVSTCYPFSETHFTAQLLTPRYFDNTNLHHYSGPIASMNFNSFATARSLRAIDVVDDRGLLLPMLPKFSSEFTNLRVLSVRVGVRWDNEIIYAICVLLPRLVRLKIVYSGKGPDDVSHPCLLPSDLLIMNHPYKIRILSLA
jgi:F-box-like